MSNRFGANLSRSTIGRGLILAAACMLSACSSTTESLESAAIRPQSAHKPMTVPRAMPPASIASVASAQQIQQPVVTQQTAQQPLVANAYQRPPAIDKATAPMPRVARAAPRNNAQPIITASLPSTRPNKPKYKPKARVTVNRPRFSDHHPVKWKGGSPHSHAVHGIDVAKYQSNINWRKAKANGVSFAFIKATEGGDHTDENFRKNWSGAKRAGVPRGAYHFYYFCRSAAQQARWFIRNVPRDKSALPAVLDMEWNHDSKTCKHRPSPSKIRREMKIFLKTITRHYGKKPIIYTSVDFYHDNQLKSFKGYNFWLRSVAAHPKHKYPNEKWLFWQYTGTGSVPGIKGKTDINVFNGSKRQWRRWLARNG